MGAQLWADVFVIGRDPVFLPVSMVACLQGGIVELSMCVLQVAFATNVDCACALWADKSSHKRKVFLRVSYGLGQFRSPAGNVVNFVWLPSANASSFKKSRLSELFDWLRLEVPVIYKSFGVTVWFLQTIVSIAMIRPRSLRNQPEGFVTVTWRAYQIVPEINHWSQVVDLTSIYGRRNVEI